MKAMTIAVLILCTASGALAQGIPAPEPAPANNAAPPTKDAATAQVKSSQTFLGHRLGETWEEFDGIEHTGQSNAGKEECSKKFVGLAHTHFKHGGVETKCQTLTLSGWQKRLTEQHLDIKFKFCPNAATGTLCDITATPLYDSKYGSSTSDDGFWTDTFEIQLNLLTQRYGKPTTAETRTFQNAYGAKWTYPTALWVLGDGTGIAATEWRNTSVGFAIAFTWTKATEAKPITNPY